MSVNKPLPTTPGVVHTEPLSKQLQYADDELSKRISVALFANKSAFSRPLQVNHPLSPKEQPRNSAAVGDAKPPGDNESFSQKQQQPPPPRHPPVALSYYNSRLAPIQNKEVLPTSYHGVYQGVPLVEEVIPVTWKPWEIDSTATGDTSCPALTPVSAVPVPVPTAKASGKPAGTAAAKAIEVVADPPKQRDKASRAQSSAGSRSRKKSIIAQGMEPTRRPQTSMQETHAKHYTEWRDIHVQSLSRVDSILREAVGLGPSNPTR
ncbi:hypothetical protein GGI21_004068, partial [Coemansia aciculifera]